MCLLFTGRYSGTVSAQITLAGLDALVLVVGKLALKIAHVDSQLASTVVKGQCFVALRTLGFGLVFGTFIWQRDLGCALT